MPCYEIKVPLGGGAVTSGFICARGSGRRRKRCVGCNALCDRLCDVPVAGKAGATCSAPVCPRCSVRLGDDDVCPRHPLVDELVSASEGLFSQAVEP